MSWGIPGLRIGRSAYGSWWISIGLPFGFRVTRRLGQTPHRTFPTTTKSTRDPTTNGQRELSSAATPNQRILDRMKRGN